MTPSLPTRQGRVSEARPANSTIRLRLGGGFRLLRDVEESGESPLGGERGGGGEKALALGEPAGAFLGLERSGMAGANRVPASRQRRDRAGAVAGEDEAKAGRGDRALVQPRRHQQERTERGADLDLVL